jgi:hypothetical protein
MSLWLRVALAVFATWRVTHLLADEDGPGDIMYRLRARLGPSFAGKLMDCFYCLSLWVAAPFALLVTRQLPMSPTNRVPMVRVKAKSATGAGSAGPNTACRAKGRCLVGSHNDWEAIR